MTLGLQAVLHQLQHGKEHVNLACTAGAGWTIQRTVPIERATTSSYAVATACSCQVYVFKHVLGGLLTRLLMHLSALRRSSALPPLAWLR